MVPPAGQMLPGVHAHAGRQPDLDRCDEPWLPGTGATDPPNHPVRPGPREGDHDSPGALLRGGRADHRRGRVRAEHYALPAEQIVQAGAQLRPQLYLPVRERQRRRRRCQPQPGQLGGGPEFRREPRGGVFFDREQD
uniref:(northern house mosquito) hypothetical protein n=1 Tax=Culex pipiens TaxID=7175 RepID=A0A8D8GVB1_CULPI